MGITSQKGHHLLKEKNRYDHSRVDFITILELFTIVYIFGTILYSIPSGQVGGDPVFTHLLFWFFLCKFSQFL